MQSYTLTKRSFINMSRDFGYYWLRLVIYIVVTICIGTIYLNVGTGYNSILVLNLLVWSTTKLVAKNTSASVRQENWLSVFLSFQARGSCASFVFGFVTFMSIGGFPSFVEDMKVSLSPMQPLITSIILSIMSQPDYLCQLQVFQRERLNGHYGVTAFVISNTLSAMPFLILITFLSGTICYFMVRLHSGFWHYVFFVLCLYASVTVVESLMMAIASIVPNFLMGIIIGAGIQVCISP